MSRAEIQISNLNHVGLVTTDVERTLRWYEEKLGFERLYRYEFPGARAVFLQKNGFRIEVFQVDGAMPPDPCRYEVSGNLKFGGLNHSSLGTADLDALVAALRAADVEIVQEPQDTPGGRDDRYAFIRDGDDLLIELFQPSETEIFR